MRLAWSLARVSGGRLVAAAAARTSGGLVYLRVAGIEWRVEFRPARRAVAAIVTESDAPTFEAAIAAAEAEARELVGRYARPVEAA